MATGEAQPQVNAEEIRDEWIQRLSRLIDEVDNWAKASGWRTRRISKTIKERELGAYKAPVLLMERDTVEVVLNPVARYVPESSGAVDLYLAPAYDDIASLYFEDNHWV